MDKTLTASSDAADEPRERSSGLATCLRAGALVLVIWSLATILTQAGTRSRETIFFQQDVMWLVADAALLVALSILSSRVAILSGAMERICRSRWSVAGMVLLATLVALVGASVVFHGFAFTQDEMLVRFDAEIFRHGSPLASLPEEWRPYWGAFQPSALQPSFILPVAGHSAWVSSYLPGNAAIHAALDDVFGWDFASVILAAIAILAGGSVARQIWPHRPDAVFVTMLLLATSSQFLLNASTPFATTAHLALNLLWLALFLRGGALRHAAALVVGTLACGLHQIIFHPLFVAPFILQLYVARRWRLAALYTTAYAAIGLFWIFYWQLMLASHGLQGLGRAAHGMSPFLQEVGELLSHFDGTGIDLMAKNVTRFLAWQNPIVVPLALLALLSLRRVDSPLSALAAGLALTTAAMFVLLPLQAFGWGYRYLHGLLGSLCLLAAGGWVLVVPSQSSQRHAPAWTSLAFASLFSLVVLLPARAFEVEAWIAPYWRAERAIQAARSDLVIVDTTGIGFGALLIRNDPFLRNRPLIMNLAGLTSSEVSSLCGSHTVSLFDDRDAEKFGLVKMDRGPEPQARDALDRLGCGDPISKDRSAKDRVR